MTQNQIEELLSQQADQLTAVQDLSHPAPAAALTGLDQAGLTPDEMRTLSGLMLIARRVHATLVEVEPKAGFVADLQARLLAQRRAANQPAANGRSVMIWVWGVVGALSLAGLGFLGYRAARAGAGWISSTAAGRNTRPALPKA